MSKGWIYFLILLFSLLGIKTLFHSGLFTAHDIWHQVVRLYYYSQAINDGQFPPYWVGQLAKGFGYPLFFFSYNFPWLMGVLLMKGGFDIATTMKTLFIISYLGSGFTMYFFAKGILKDDLAAFLSSVLYLWLPYHFLVIFVGASLGIAFIFTFLPMVFSGIHLSANKSKLGLIILSIGVAGIILSHIMHLIFLFPVILFFLVWELKQTHKKFPYIIKITSGLILGILISSFYLLPALFYNSSTRIHLESGFSEIYKRNFINFNQLVYSKWGFAPIVNNAKNGEISFQMGIAQWISIISLFFLLIWDKISKVYRSLTICLLFSQVVNIFLMLDSSAPFWKLLTRFVTVDFPFRLLLPTGFISSICAGVVLLNFNKNIRIFACTGLILLTLYTNRNYINVNQYTNFSISTYLGLETEITTNTFNEYLPVQADPGILNKPWNEAVGDNLSISKIRQTTNLLTFNISSAKEQTVSVGQFYFPGQSLYLDHHQTFFNIDPQGRISFKLPKGFHLIAIKFEQTPLIRISRLLSLFGIFTLIFLFLKQTTFNKS